MPAATHPLSLNPLLDEVAVTGVLQTHWGLHGALSDLGSLQDQNVRVRTPDGAQYVLKIMPSDAPLAEVELQNDAMRYVAGRGADFDSPQTVPSVGGAHIVKVDGVYCRLLTWVAGTPLGDRPRLCRPELFALGELGARVALTLDGFEHPEVNRALIWDPRRSAEVVARLAEHIEDPGLRERLVDAAQLVGSVPADLPTAVVHGDVTPTNVVTGGVDSSGPGVRLTGVVDFGDVMRTWRMADVAAAVIGALEHPGVEDTLEAALAVLAGYHAVSALEPTEADAFWPLVRARSALNSAISRVQAVRNPTNWYALDGVESSARALDAVAAVPNAVARAGARAVLGVAASARIAPARPAPIEFVDGVHTARVLDLSVDSDEWDGGEWRAADPLARRVPPAGVAITRWGECRLSVAGELQSRAPRNLSLGVDVFAPSGASVRAPVTGTVRAVGTDELLLAPDRDAAAVLDPPTVRISGLSPAVLDAGARVSAGEVLGQIAPGRRPHVSLQLLTGPELPRLGSARTRDAWLGACPDPSPLLGRDLAAPEPPSAAERRRVRERVVARPQHLYYEQPVEMVRGWRHFLYDSTGRGYLDMINNIASVGHSHPRVTAAAHRQLRRLNTNSRFLYEPMTRYCALMADTLPAGLDQIFLVNSGSEAADLALQLARAATGRHDVAAISGAYHGWTGAVLAVSSSPNDRPQWRTELQPGNHVVAAPYAYRGELGVDAGAYVASVESACAAAAARAGSGGGLAAFVTEPLLGNQGAVEPITGYLAGAYESVRRAGGLCIADEVQVGMARTGDFWAFEHEAVVPDIVYTAKAAGNGHPLGVVACTAEVADAFDRSSAFFASTGGGPVSCEIGSAVLEVIRDEGLADNARHVGAHLKQALEQLAEAHPLIGAVHGRGLYLGVELVVDRATKQPAAAEATEISERLLDLGVVMQPTGDALNVLKVKPPLCLDEPAADFFVAMLDRVLGERTA